MISVILKRKKNKNKFFHVLQFLFSLLFLFFLLFLFSSFFFSLKKKSKTNFFDFDVLQKKNYDFGDKKNKIKKKFPFFSSFPFLFLLFFSLISFFSYDFGDKKNKLKKMISVILKKKKIF